MPAGTLTLHHSAKRSNLRRKTRLTRMRTVHRSRGVRQISRYGVQAPFPPRMTVKQGYSEIHTLTTGALGVFGAEFIYRTNDQFDPNFLVGGHQPYGRDTLASLYSKYKVTGIMIELTATNPSADGLAVGIMMSPPNQASPLAGNGLGVAQERNNVKIKFVNNTGSQVVKFKQYWPIWKLAQVTKLQFDANATDFTALSGVTPTITTFLRIAAADTPGTGGLTIQVMLRLTYYTTWYDRITLPQS